jgi:hypothetical protein
MPASGQTEKTTPLALEDDRFAIVLGEAQSCQQKPLHVVTTTAAVGAAARLARKLAHLQSLCVRVAPSA